MLSHDGLPFAKGRLQFAAHCDDAREETKIKHHQLVRHISGALTLTDPTTIVPAVFWGRGRIPVEYCDERTGRAAQFAAAG